MADRSLARLDAATRMLSEIRSAADGKRVANLAEAARIYAKKVGLGLRAQNQAAAIKLRAERRAGELLAEMGEKRGGSKTRGAFLKPLGIDDTESSRWQTIAKIPKPDFDEHLHAALEEESKAELTEAGMLRLARSAELGVHFSTGTEDWNTPAPIIQRTVAALGGTIDLDPCSNSEGRPNVPARRHFTPRDDGLARPWRGAVYMNPPYGRVIGDWVQKLVKEHVAGNVPQAVALVPARTDTDWFHLLRDAAICFVDGRLRFSGSETGAPFPSAACYLGPNRGGFASAFADVGDIWVRLA